jgi:hypothetical protein
MGNVNLYACGISAYDYIIYKEDTSIELYYAKASIETGLPDYENDDFAELLMDVLNHFKCHGDYSPQTHRPGGSVKIKAGNYYAYKTIQFPVLQDFIFHGHYAGLQSRITNGDAFVFTSMMNCRFEFGEVHSKYGTSGATIRFKPDRDMFGDYSIMTSEFKFGCLSNPFGTAMVFEPNPGKILENSIVIRELINSDVGIYFADNGIIRRNTLNVIARQNGVAFWIGSSSDVGVEHNIFNIEITAENQVSQPGIGVITYGKNNIFIGHIEPGSIAGMVLMPGALNNQFLGIFDEKIDYNGIK